jgi:predicted Fe-Mo cluster-binding NifX family protein
VTETLPRGYNPRSGDRGNVKVLITLYNNDVAPRFDLATEVLIVGVDANGATTEEKNIVLPQASAEALCQLILAEGVHTVVCGGIEDEYYQYLTWKKIKVLDSVIASRHRVLALIGEGTLKEGTILLERPTRGSDDD